MSDEEIKESAERHGITGITPVHVLGGKLIKFLTIVDTNLKRYAGEFLFNLCGDQATFIKRVGYGAGAHMVAIRAGTIGGIIAQQDKEREEREATANLSVAAQGEAQGDAAVAEVIEVIKQEEGEESASTSNAKE
jgi:hypothetical protein